MSYYQGLQAEPVRFRGRNGDQGEAYYARRMRLSWRNKIL